MLFEKILEHKFFKEDYANLARSRLEKYCELWWSIQPTVTIGFVKFLGTMASEIERLTRQNQDTTELEKLFGKIFPAIEDEMGGGRDPHKMMHHLLFLKQLTLCGLLKPTWSETNLSEKIRNAFVNSDFRVGLTMAYVIETLAQKLFEKQREIFSEFSDELLPYTCLHMTLEAEHGNEALDYEGWTKSELIEEYLQDWSDHLDQCHTALTGAA